MSEITTPDKAPAGIYYINTTARIALARVNDIVCQEWQALGKVVSADAEFDHRHSQTIYPDKERLDEYINKNFIPATLEEYLSIQFEHHQLDDYFRAKANQVKEKLFNPLSK